jgi:O-antigen/teichoic acid export membrane protein
MSIARKIFFNTFSQILGKVVLAVFGIFILKLLSNYLGRSGYGEYTAAFDFLSFFSIVGDLGLYTIGVREMAKDEKKIPMIVGNILTVRTIISVLMIGIAIFSAFYVPKFQETRIPFGVILVGISMVLNLLTSTVSTVLQVHLKMQYNSLASVAGKAISLSYMVLTAFMLFPQDKVIGFYHVILAGIFGNAVMLLITYYYSRKLTNIRYRVDLAFWKEVLVKALPYGIALILNTVYFRIGSLLLTMLKSTDEVGAYGVAMRMMEAISIIPLYFMNAILPVLTGSLERKDGSHKKIIQYAFDFLVMGSMPLIAGTVVLAYPIVYLTSSAEYLSNLKIGSYGSDVALQILIFALAFSFINSLFGFIVVAANQQNKLLVRNIFGAALTLVLDLIFIPYFGLRAAAFDNVLTELYIAVASYFIARHYVQFSINFKNTFKIALSAIFMGVCVYFLRDPLFNLLQSKSIIILVPLGGIIYVGMLFLTKTITKEMINLIRKPKKPGVSIES